ENLLKHLIANTEFNSDLIYPHLISQVFKRKDPALLNDLRKKIQEMLAAIPLQQLNQSNFTSEQAKQLNTQIADLLTLYTLLDQPTTSMKQLIVLPQQNQQGLWKQVTFFITPISFQVNASCLKTEYLLEKNEIYAYLFTPQTQLLD